MYDQPFSPEDWYPQYVQTYLERDVPHIISLKNRNSFHRFLRLLAGRTGQRLNMSDLARDADVSHTAVREWLSVLEAGYIIFILQPGGEFFYWSAQGGPEIDLLYREGTKMYACEIKSSATFRPVHTKNLEMWAELSGIGKENLFRSTTAMSLSDTGEYTFFRGENTGCLSKDVFQIFGHFFISV